MKSIKVDNSDFQNELGKAFEQHTGILFAKMLKKENNIYFNIKFDINHAIRTIKEKLFRKLILDKSILNYEKYKAIKELIEICDKYLDKLKTVNFFLDDSYENESNLGSSNIIFNDIYSSSKEYDSYQYESKQNICSDFSSYTFGSADENNKSYNPNINKVNKTKKIRNKNEQGNISYYESESSIKENKNKNKKLSKGEIDVLISNVTKEELNKITDKNANKYFVSKIINEIPDTFNIIIETCLNLSTQMKAKKIQIRKYSIISRLLEELYEKNKNFLEEYLSPFKKNNQNILSSPYFIYIIATNSAYTYFKISSKKFIEDKTDFNCNLFIFYIKFKLNSDITNILENNGDVNVLEKIEELQNKLNSVTMELKSMKSEKKIIVFSFVFLLIIIIYFNLYKKN